jgi:hypothetical protein
VEHSKLLFGLVAVLGVVFVVVWVVSAWMCALTIPEMHHRGNENDLIMKISLTNTNPLVLSVGLRSNCTDDIVYLVGAQVKDYNQSTVAEYWGKWGNAQNNGAYIEPICVLREFGATEILTLNFENSLPAGYYTLWFCSIGGVVASSGEVFTRANVERAIYPLAHAIFTIP